jgi:hypothetical protein
MMLQLFLMLVTAATFYSLYKRGRSGTLKSGQKKGTAKKNNDSSGGWFGGGMGNIGKSSATTYGEDKKIDIRVRRLPQES